MSRTKISVPHRQIEEFCRKWNISELALFGSVLSDDFRPDSDIDVLVSFQSDAECSLFDLVEMTDELEAIFGRKVDLVEKDAIRNPFQKQAILAAHEVIYEA